MKIKPFDLIALLFSLIAITSIAAIPFLYPSDTSSHPPLGVTNADAFHLNCTDCTTATPAFLVDQNGTGKIIEAKDAATPVFSVNDGGSVVINKAIVFGQQTTGVTASFVITPTTPYQVLTSTLAVTSSTATPIITTTASTGQQLTVQNGNTSNAIVIDGTGGTTACGADISLGAGDVVNFIYNGTAWACTGLRDN